MSFFIGRADFFSSDFSFFRHSTNFWFILWSLLLKHLYFVSKTHNFIFARGQFLFFDLKKILTNQDYIDNLTSISNFNLHLYHSDFKFFLIFPLYCIIEYFYFFFEIKNKNCPEKK